MFDIRRVCGGSSVKCIAVSANWTYVVNHVRILVVISSIRGASATCSALVCPKFCLRSRRLWAVYPALGSYNDFIDDKDLPEGQSRDQGPEDGYARAQNSDIDLQTRQYDRGWSQPGWIGNRVGSGASLCDARQPCDAYGYDPVIAISVMFVPKGRRKYEAYTEPKVASPAIAYFRLPSKSMEDREKMGNVRTMMSKAILKAE